MVTRKPHDRPYDILLFGATGFTGGLTAEYLARHAPAGLRWALVRRNRDKLDAVRQRLAAISPACAELSLLKVDVADQAAVTQAVRSTRVVITTVGPYIRYGEPLVAACAAAGTDYVDLTGEPEFVDLMWLRHHDTAVASGARLIHCCGFDSIPHDLGAYFTVQHLPRDVPLRVNGYVRASGQISAGTYHSALDAFSRLRSYARLARQRRQREGRVEGRRIRKLPARIHHDAQLAGWVLPMPTIDPQIVRRSARALDVYGPDFGYAHFVQVKSFATVAALTGGVAALFALAQLKPTRQWLRARKQSGEGPDGAQRARARFRVRFVGESTGPQPQRVVCDVLGGDPGYGETSKMLAESALALVYDDLPPCAGQVTTAQAMGDALIARLRNAGIRFEVVEAPSGAAA